MIAKAKPLPDNSLEAIAMVRIAKVSRNSDPKPRLCAIIAAHIYRKKSSVVAFTTGRHTLVIIAATQAHLLRKTVFTHALAAYDLDDGDY